MTAGYKHPFKKGLKSRSRTSSAGRDTRPLPVSSATLAARLGNKKAACAGHRRLNGTETDLCSHEDPVEATSSKLFAWRLLRSYDGDRHFIHCGTIDERVNRFASAIGHTCSAFHRRVTRMVATAGIRSGIKNARFVSQGRIGKMLAGNVPAATPDFATV